MRLRQILTIALTVSTLMACGNLSDVSKQGTTDNPVWPEVKNSSFNGSWENWDNINLIEKGMNKEQIYNLIDRPHFNEGLFNVREWDYVFNFRENGEHKICQFKILFDNDMIAQSFLWKPENCANRYELSNDFLFAFNADKLSDKGREYLGQVAEKLREQQLNQINIAGYTDRLGSEAYNLDLSQRRADSVKQYLISAGLSADIIVAVGYGKADEVKTCDVETDQALKDCLAPNRRVVITAE